MTLPLLLAAAAEAHGAEASIPERFGLEPKYIIMQVISFLIVLAVLYKWGIKPVTATMEERNRKIEAGIKHAEEMQAKLASLQPCMRQHRGQGIAELALKRGRA